MLHSVAISLHLQCSIIEKQNTIPLHTQDCEYQEV